MTQAVAEYDGATGNMRRRYMWGPGADEPILVDEGGMNCSTTKFLHTDERGSVVALANCYGTRLAVQNYDEHGVPAPANAAVNAGGRFGYTGQMWVPELGLWYYKARMYSPTLGRFMQTDPIGYADGMNWYDYVGGDPVNASDPSGTHCADGSPGGSAEDCRDHGGHVANSQYLQPSTEVVVTGHRSNGAAGLRSGSAGIGVGGANSLVGAKIADVVLQYIINRISPKRDLCRRREWHNLKVDEKVSELRATGFQVSTNVSIIAATNVFAGAAVADYLATKDFQVYYIGEVKTVGAALSLNQRANYVTGRAMVIGDKAKSIGAPNGTRINLLWRGEDRFPGCP